MTSAWYFKDTLRTEIKSFLISKLGFPCFFYTLTPSISTHYYLISSKLPFNAQTTKFPAEKKTTENLRMYSVTWQSTLGEFVKSHRREYFSIYASNWYQRLVILWIWTIVTSIWNNHRWTERIENRRRLTMGMSFHKKGSVAVYSRSLRAYRKKRTSPKCLKIKRNCINTLDFSISILIIILQ